MNCPFCEPDINRIFYDDDPMFLCCWDGFPVSTGHALIIPRRHVATWFEATAQEQESLLKGIEIAKREIEKQYQPDGFNIGINVGEAAGQTVHHLHVHVIPRYKGDVEDPRGGVRYVIPDKANYLGVRDTPATYQVNMHPPSLGVLTGMDVQDDSIGLFGFVGQAMEDVRLPLVAFCDFGSEKGDIRVACRLVSPDSESGCAKHE